jgi:hypothetical protein
MPLPAPAGGITCGNTDAWLSAPRWHLCPPQRHAASRRRHYLRERTMRTAWASPARVQGPPLRWRDGSRFQALGRAPRTWLAAGTRAWGGQSCH